MSAPMLRNGMNTSCTATSASTSTICTFCCHYGHVEAECFRRAEWVQHYAEVAQQKKQTKTRRGKAKRATVASNAPHTDGSDTGSFSARLENTSLSPTEEFAGYSATALSISDLCTPIIPDARSDWITDTGATRHMTPHRHWFNTYTPYKTPIRLANNHIVYSAGVGSVRFQAMINGKPGHCLNFQNVLHVPLLRNNLLAVLYLTRQKQFHVSIWQNKLKFKRDRKILLTATIDDSNTGYLTPHTSRAQVA